MTTSGRESGPRFWVERSCVRLKQLRGIATRYDKHAPAFLGGVLLVAAIIHTETH